MRGGLVVMAMLAGCGFSIGIGDNTPADAPPDTAIDAAIDVAIDSSSCPPFYRVIGTGVYAVLDPTNFKNHVTACASHGTHLAIIDGKQELDDLVVYGRTVMGVNNNSRFYVGLVQAPLQAEPEDSWVDFADRDDNPDLWAQRQRAQRRRRPERRQPPGAGRRAPARSRRAGRPGAHRERPRLLRVRRDFRRARGEDVRRRAAVGILPSPVHRLADRGIRAIIMPVMLPMLFALMTYNLHYANPDPDGSMDAIATADADVVLLQEITAAWKTRLDKRFAKQYPHRVFHPGRAGGLAVLSKHEIRADELFSPPSGGFFPAERLVVDSPLGEVQILHVHLRPNVDRGNWVLGWQTTPPVRRREIETYWKKLATGTPTIVAGDFNELPTGKAVEFLADKGLARIETDGPTSWHHLVEVNGKKVSALSMDIDHVVVDRSFKASKAHVLDAGASDHRPVVVTLERASR